jgi:CheY-like chemotaxis protein/signal transduction histidine kinase
MKFYHRIHTQLIFGFLLVALIPAIIIGFFTQKTAIEALRKQEFLAQAAIIQSLKPNIEAFLTTTQNNLLALSQSQPLKRYLDLRRTHPNNSPLLEEARQACEQEFLAFARNQGIYYQVSYLNENGQPMVRIDTDANQTQIRASNQLQNHVKHNYFTKTMRLYENEIFMSLLELKKEHGQIEVPHKPVIRFATPVFYPNGRSRAGIMITHLNANQLLHQLDKVDKNVWLVEQLGHYLAHPDVNKKWGGLNDLKSGSTLVQDYPSLGLQILAEQAGNFSNEQFMLTFQRISLPNRGHWTLIIQQPTHEIIKNIHAIKVFVGIILGMIIGLSLIIALFLKRVMVNPLAILTQMTEQVRTGERKVRAKIKHLNEIGMFTKGFNAMLEAIQTSETDLKQAQQEALAASLAKSRFLANMGHDLRTPLNAIIGYGEMLHEEIELLGETELGNDIKKIYSSGRFLQSMIDDILGISKIEAGKMELYTETFFLPNMIDDAVRTIQPLLTTHQDTLKVHYDGDIGEMSTDLTKLRQVLLKLLSNASKFNKQQNKILLSVSHEVAEDDKDWVVFRVQDNGMGMDDKQQQQLSEIFAQLDTPTSSQFGSRSSDNLGFAVTNHLIRMMGGDISVKSELGKGSTFMVRLPVKIEMVPEHLSSNSPQELAVLEEGGVVLVIDDDAEAREMLQRYLDKSGYQVEIAGGGEEGLRLAKKAQPDLIILDVMMPNMDGWEVLSLLKADPELTSIPVVILSMMEDKSVAYSLGASDYLLKPITREQLTKILQKYHFSHNESARLVMIIDDDPVNRDMVARMLKKAGFRVGKVEDGRIALNYIEKKQPDLILLDLQMPEMDGFEFVARLHKIYGDSIPVILMTAKDLTKEDRLRLDENVANIFQKGSYSREELLLQVEKLLAAN